MSVHARKLLVEGDTDLRVIAELMEANGVEWERDGKPVVHIEPSNGADELLKKGVIESEMQATGLEALGLVIDANGDARKQWTRIRERCQNALEGELPDAIPERGLDVRHVDGRMDHA